MTSETQNKVNAEGPNVSPSEKFKCDQCEVQYSRKDSLKKHIRFAHEGIADFSCPVCKKGFINKRDFKYHCENVHKGKRKGPRPAFDTKDFDYETLFCQQCDYSCKKSQQLKIHIEAKHEGKRYNCPQCDKEYQYLYDLKKHINSDHEGYRINNCPYCEKEYEYSNDLKKHIKADHEEYRFINETLFCKQCYYSCKKGQQLNNHIAAKHEGKKHNCPQCDKEYTYSNDLKKHIKADHEGYRINKCDKCPYSTKRRWYLKIHEKRRHQVKMESVSVDNLLQPRISQKSRIQKSKIKQLRCKKCSYTTKRKTNLKLHRRKYHSSKSERATYSCPDCEQEFLEYKELKVHIKEYHRRIGFKCDHCDFVTSRRKSLKVHQKIHFMFKECGKPSEESTKSAEAQLFPCHICDWEASNHAILMEHILQHKDEIRIQMSGNKSKQSNNKTHEDYTGNQLKQDSVVTKPKISEPESEEDKYSVSKDGTIWYNDPVFGKIPVISKTSSEVDINVQFNLH